MKTFIALAISIFFISINSFAQSDTTELIIKVKGITCANDLNIIHGKVKELDGIYASDNQGEVGPATDIKVVFNPSVIDPESIYQRIEDSPSCDHPDQRPYKVKR